MGVVQEKMYMNVDDVCEILGVSKQIISKIKRKRCDHVAENTEKYPGDYNAGFFCVVASK